MKLFADGIHLRWEKATARGVRYYEVDLHRDLWGEQLLARAWGRRGTRLAWVRVAPCGSRDEGLSRIAAILTQRQQRRYRLVARVDSDSDIRRSLLAHCSATRTAAVPEPRTHPGHAPGLGG